MIGRFLSLKIKSNLWKTKQQSNENGNTHCPRCESLTGPMLSLIVSSQSSAEPSDGSSSGSTSGRTSKAERQSRLQKVQVKFHAGLSALGAVPPLVLLASCCWARVASRLGRPFFKARLQADRSRATASHLSWSTHRLCKCP